MILQALRACTRIFCPAVIHLEEAIAGPAEMLTFLGKGEHTGHEGNLACHNNLMVQYWSALATRDTNLMAYVLKTHSPEMVPNATYVAYLRCHDDIEGGITDEDAGALGFSGAMHRSYLTEFYEGSFPGSFSRGAFFQENEATGDKRVSGSLASLVGLEKAIAENDTTACDTAIQRIMLGNALIAAFGGVPVLFMGDEVVHLNDYGYLDVPEHANDSRWLHRPAMGWGLVNKASDKVSVPGQILDGTRHILSRRKSAHELHGAIPTRILEAEPKEVFAFARLAPTGNVVCLFNFSEQPQEIPEGWLDDAGVSEFLDLLSGDAVMLYNGKLHLPSYGRVWLR